MSQKCAFFAYEFLDVYFILANIVFSILAYINISTYYYYIYVYFYTYMREFLIKREKNEKIIAFDKLNLF